MRHTLLRSFERNLARYFPATDRTLLGQALHYSLFPGGKRIRPALCLAAYRACGGRVESAIMPFACGIELIHSFSLIQDDLPSMDNDRERRGKPTLHVAFGEAVALLASDALFARAFELFTESTAPARARLAALREVTQAIGADGIVEGQLQDLNPPEPGPKTLRRIHLLKTARLIAACFAVGATVAGARPAAVDRMRWAGTYLGMLFQITDDLIDRGEQGKLTYVAQYGVAGAARRGNGYVRRYLEELRLVRPRLDRLGHLDLVSIGAAVVNRKH